jgi:hypothetical protein
MQGKGSSSRRPSLLCCSLLGFLTFHLRLALQRLCFSSDQDDDDQQQQEEEQSYVSYGDGENSGAERRLLLKSQLKQREQFYEVIGRFEIFGDLKI